ncbi:protein-tyrosine phosphatase-like protein [Pelagophyceae sp. CCMP2097]|nr:protein-tyrosine phosphatase-like protein [Pelagophyceae sp. CCMP2097]|mmetsp:Transcript_9329/g.32739  ORF Transcript_9329/g.32739 Transcript_9329/m.32739 type:complete len:316 (-) Transcript_9329:32-979(-)
MLPRASLALLLLVGTDGLALTGVRNFRPLAGAAAALPISRSANLDAATEADAQRLISLGPRIIELRNRDEGKRHERSAGSVALYAALSVSERPILEDTDAFWTAVRLDAPRGSLAWENVAMIWSAEPLNAALSRTLERGGLAALYRATLRSAPLKLGAVAREVLECVEAGQPVVFNCQKGKDRTGLVAALLETTIGVPRARVVDSYSLSGANLGGEDARAAGEDASAAAAGGAGSPASAAAKDKDAADIDWSIFRGSPAAAMASTLAWLDGEFGGVDKYLDQCCGFSLDEQLRLRTLAAAPAATADAPKTVDALR